MRHHVNLANGQIVRSSWDGRDSTFWELCLGQTLELPHSTASPWPTWGGLL